MSVDVQYVANWWFGPYSCPIDTENCAYLNMYCEIMSMCGMKLMDSVYNQVCSDKPGVFMTRKMHVSIYWTFEGIQRLTIWMQMCIQEIYIRLQMFINIVTHGRNFQYYIKNSFEKSPQVKRYCLDTFLYREEPEWITMPI